MRARPGCGLILRGLLLVIVSCLVFLGLAGALVFSGEVSLYAPHLVAFAPLPGHAFDPMTPITLTFDQPMEPSSVEFALSLAPPVAGSFQWNESQTTVTFVPEPPGYLPGTSYQVRLERGAVAARIPRKTDRDVQWSFALAPLLASQIPEGRVEGASANPDIQAVFNYTLDCPSTLREFTIVPEATGILDCQGREVRFTLTEPLSPDTAYVAELGAVYLEADQSPRPGVRWSIQTAEPLEIVQIEPDQDENIWDLWSSMQVTFNRPILPSSVVNRLSLRSDDSGDVAGEVTFQDEGAKLVFRPLTSLYPDASYVLGLEPGIQDRLGFELALPAQVQFRTEAMVADPDPLPDSRNVALDSRLLIPFSRPMDEASVEAGLTITPAIDGLPTWEGNTLVLVPQGGLDPNADYVVSLGADIRDENQARLARDRVWTFHTRPFLLEANVPSGSNIVALQQPIEFSFALPVDRSSLRAALVITPAVSGTLTFGNQGRTASFQPEPGWAPGTDYQVTLSKAATSSLGSQHVGQQNRWEFSTSWVQVQLGAGAGVQSLDSAGSRTLHTLVQGSDVADFALYAITPTQFLDLYAASMERMGSDGPAIVDTTTLSTTVTWRAALNPLESPSTQGEPWLAEVRIPDDLPDGMYVLSTLPAHKQGEQLLVVLSRHALVVKATPHRGEALPAQAVFWGVELASGAPVVTATVQIYDREGILIGEGQTDEQGLGSLEMAEGAEPFMAFLEKEGIWTACGMGREWQSGRVDSGILAHDPAALVVDTVTDLPAYYSGQTVSFRQTLRLDPFAAPLSYTVPGPNLPVAVRLRDAKDRVVATRVLTPTVFGTVQGSFLLADRVLTGTWTLETTLEDLEAISIYPVPVETSHQADDSPVSDSMAAPFGSGDVVELSLNQLGYRPDQEVSLSAFASDGSGNPVPGKALVATLVDAEGVQVAEATGITDEQGRAEFSLASPSPGRYQLVVGEQNIKTESHGVEEWIWVYDSGSQGAAFFQPGADPPLALYVDRSEYQVGDTAEILVVTSVGGPALLTYERGAVYHTETLDLIAGTNIMTIPVRAEYAPNIDIVVSQFQPNMGSLDLGRSLPDRDLRTARAPLRVSLAERLLALEVQPEQETLAPGDDVMVTVRTANQEGRPVPAEVSLFVIDEATYRQTRDTCEVPFDVFFGPRPNRIVSNDSVQPTRWLNPVAEPVEQKAPPSSGVSPWVCPHTSLWEPTVVTDEKGEAVLTVTLPEDMGAWRLVARGVTTNTLVGYATAKLTVTQALTVEPDLPRLLLQGDVITMTSLVHNATSKPISATVHIAASGLSLVNSEQTVSLPARGSAMTYWTARAEQVGWATVAVEATGLRAGTRLVGRDMAEIQARVEPVGITQVRSYVGEVVPGANAVLTITLPFDETPEAGRADLMVSSSLVGGIVQGLEYLRNLPGTYVEQSVSRMIPHSLAANAFGAAGIPTGRGESGLMAPVELALQSLYTFQNDDGGWGWRYGDGTDAYQTAYVLLGLALTGESGIDVDQSTVERGASALSRLMPKADPATKAFGMLALDLVGQPVTASLTISEVLALDPFSQAAVALALGRRDGTELGQIADEGLIAALLDGFTESVVFEGEMAYWPTVAGMSIMGSDVKTTALVTVMLQQVAPQSALLPPAMNWLMTQRQADAWGDAHATSYALWALTDYFLQNWQELPEVGYEVYVNDQLWRQGVVETLEIEHRMVLTHGTPISPTLVSPGENRVEIMATEPADARGPLSYRVNLAEGTFKHDDVPEAEARQGSLSLERSYYVVDEVSGAVDPVQTIDFGRGDLIQVLLAVDVAQATDYVLIEDALPAGIEIVSRFPSVWARTARAAPEFAQSRLWDGIHSMDVRDNRVMFYLSDIQPGEHTVTYWVRATTSGDFAALPAQACLAYDKKQQAISSSTRIYIRDVE